MSSQPPQWGAPTPAPAPGAWTPPPAPTYSQTKTDGMAIAALVCAIAAFVVCPVILAVVALALAHAAGNRIDASAGTKGGNGLVRAAQIVAWVHLGLVLVGLAIAVIAIAANGGEITTDSLRAVASITLR